MDNAKIATTVGVIDANTLLATRASGIERSTNLGESWTSVSDVTPLGHVFLKHEQILRHERRRHLGQRRPGCELAEARRRHPQHQNVPGPYFGADDDTMVVGTQPDDNPFGGGSSVYKTTDGGASWNKVADVPAPGNAFPISLAWLQAGHHAAGPR